MTQPKEAVNLFQRAEKMMIDYADKIENLQQLIKRRLEHDVPLPHDAKVALQNPDDEMFLLKAMHALDHGKTATIDSANALRYALANANVGDAIYIVGNWSWQIDRPLESVLSQTYKDSVILPPPPYYLSRIDGEILRLFPVNFDNPTDLKSDIEFSKYLLTVENPWAKYATK